VVHGPFGAVDLDYGVDGQSVAVVAVRVCDDGCLVTLSSEFVNKGLYGRILVLLFRIYAGNLQSGLSGRLSDTEEMSDL